MDYPNADSTAEKVEPENTLDSGDTSIQGLSQEVRRVGREVFKANRTAERNQTAFETALDEIQQLHEAILHLPNQTADAVFEAKASVSRELLRVLDTLEESMAAAHEIRARLESDLEQYSPDRLGIAGIFSVVQRMRQTITDSISTLIQWYEGQELLYQRVSLVLRAANVRKIETLNTQFNPEIHRAISVEEHTDVPAGTVVREELSGYLLDNRVLRFAEVVVAKNG